MPNVVGVEEEDEGELFGEEELFRRVVDHMVMMISLSLSLTHTVIFAQLFFRHSV